MDLNEISITRADNVHIRISIDILFVTKIEHRDTFNNSNAHCSNRLTQRLAISDDMTFLLRPGNCVGKCNICACNRRRASAAICLQNITVDHDRILSKRVSIDHCT